MSKTRFAELVKRAIAELPEQFRRFLDEVPVDIRQRPSRKLLRSVGLDEDELLLGLYHGRALTEQSVDDPATLPATITIFQEDVELSADDEAELVREVRTTLLHELGHHFGLDEDDLAGLGYA